MTAARKKPKDRLKWLIQHGHIAPEFESLGDTILKVAERKASEPSPHMPFAGSGGGLTDGGGPLGRVSAHQRWDRMMKSIGSKGEAVVSAVIVEGMSMDEAAKSLNVHPKAILPLLQFSLDILGKVAA